MSLKINSLSTKRSYTAMNSYVTKSYLELFNKTKFMNGAKFMGYIYGNASHHLGRLIRYNAWPADHYLKELDRSFVEGAALRAITQVANFKLAPTLMNYSKDLYQELSWSLASASLCGMDYTLKMVKNPLLAKAYSARHITDFVIAFVAFEQSYLQLKMYQDLAVKLPAKATILDEMRYMSFNGERHTSFSQWCLLNSCGTSSYNLRNRIKYDIWAILNELKLTKANSKVLSTRLKNAKIEEITHYFLQRN